MSKLLSVLLLFPIIFISCSGEKESTQEEQTEVVFEDSLDYYEMKFKADPNNPKIKFERAKYFVRQGEIDLAIEDLKDVLAKDSSNLKAQKLYADISLATLDLESAKYHYEYILGRDSTNPEALLGMAKIFAALNNFAKADFYISSSLRSNPYSADPYFTRGLIYRSDYYITGREESWNIAQGSFQTAIEQEPDYYEAFIELGVMHAEKGDSIALEYYNSALAIYPESIEAWYNKGYYYQTKGYVDDALSCFYTLIDIDSTWYKPYYNLGHIHLIMTDEFDSAVYYFEKCTYWDPGNYAAYNNLGYAWETKGDKQKARRFYQKAIELNPEFDLAKDNLNLLDKKQ